MKKLITLGITALALFLGTAFAGDYHTGATLNCSECHNMHYSQDHGYNPDGTGNFTALSTGPHEYLLRAEVNTLCLNCHDNQTFAPDVLAANGGTALTNGRLAGGLNSPATAVAGYFPADGHTLGSTDVAPGGTFKDSTGLECVDCHSPHGRTVTVAGVRTQQYRNLNWYLNGSTTGNGSMSYAIGTNDLGKDVFERSASMGGSHYDLSNVDYNEPDPTQSSYGKFCGQCHTNFHGLATASNISDGSQFVRHPTAGVDIADVSTFAAAAYRVKTMSQSGSWGTQGTVLANTTTSDNTPSCMSCHRSHGSANPFGLIYPDYVAGSTAKSGSLPIGENGSVGGTYKGLCKQCHRIG
jgi:hypothetical protein